MEKLKKVLALLLDESKSLKDRINKLFPKKGPSMIRSFGKAVATPILLVVYPEKYGVYNKITETALKNVGIMLEFNRETSFAERYEKINSILSNLANENNLSLFQLDEVWWKLVEIETLYENDEGEELISEEAIPEDNIISTQFRFEVYLRRFLVDNWESTELDQKYEILTEDGEIIGENYHAKNDEVNAGDIDVLTRDRETNDYVIIELKKGRSNDQVIGKVLRYMGWFQKFLAKNNEKVRGIIVVNEMDKKLEMAFIALKGIDIKCYQYRAQFFLNKIDV